MRPVSQALLVFCALGLTSSPAWAVSAIEQSLIDKAKYWEGRGRPDLAVQSWEKVLQMDPGQPDALAGSGIQDAQAGRNAEAADKLALLRKNYPDHPGVARLAAALKKGRVDVAQEKKALDEARSLARAGRYEEAAAAYRRYYGGVKPQGSAAIEYYEVLAGTSGGWQEAKEGVEGLVASNPGNPRYSLALGRILSYQEKTRRQAIERLSGLVEEPSVAEDAKSAWRQALIWLDGRAPDLPLYQRYLSRYPDDKQVAARMEQIMHPPKEALDPITAERMRAYSELQSGRLREAEEGFQSTLKQRPNDAAAIAGLAIIRMRRQEFREARDLYQQAMNRDPAGRAQWEPGLREANLWLRLKEADAAREHGELARAETLLREAERYDNKNRPALLALSALLSERGKLGEAEKGYRQVLKSSPGNAAALKGLSTVLAKEGRGDEAEKLLETLSASQRSELDSLGGLKSDMLRAQAREAEKAGDLHRAQMSLEEAMLRDPSSPWTRLDLARVYQKEGESAKAKSVIDGLLDANPDQPDALFARALISGEDKNWTEGLATLEKIRLEDRTEAMYDTQKRFWVNAMAERSVIYYRQGRMSEAKEALRQAEAVAGKSGELVGVVASAMAEENDPRRALATMRRAIRESAKPPIGLKLRYAGILLRTHQDAELAPLLEELTAQSESMNAAQKKDLNDLNVGLALRRADDARGRGDLARGYDILAPYLDADPTDARLQMALARLYSAAGDHAKALGIYQQVLALDADNTDAIQAAANEALSLGETRLAGRLVSRGMALAPDNPRMTALAGRVARAEGRNAEALEYFRKALAQERSAARAGEIRLVSPYSQVEAAPASGYSSFNPFAGDRRAPPAEEERPRFSPYPPAKPVAPRSLNDYPDAVPTRTADSYDYPAPRQAAASNAYDYPAPRQAAPSSAYDYPAPRQAAASSFPYESTPRQAAAASAYDYPVPRQAAPQQPYEAAPRPLPVVRASRPAPAETALEDEIDELRLKYSTALSAGGEVRNRSGEAGMSQLLDVEIPFKAEIHPGLAGPLTVSASPVSLSAGDLNLTDPAVAKRFGSNSLGAPVPGLVTQRADGIALGISYRFDSLKADIGTSPLGFPVVNVVGGLRWETKLGEGMNAGVELSRRSVTDSLLSYAGARDPNTGGVWGGVVSTGLALDFGLDATETGYYLKAGLHRLTGSGVAANNKFDVSAGAYYYLLRSDDESLTVGGNITTLAYTKNLGFFTLGQGGYFSPQSYFSVGLPVNWTGTSGRLAFDLAASLGVQNFRQNASPYFPANGSLQSQLVQFAQGTPGVITDYAASTTSGFGYALSGALEYQVAPKFRVGGKVALDNASNYSQQSGLLYLRYSFLPQPLRATLPLAPLKPYNLGEAP